MDSKNTTGSPTKDMDFEGKVEGVETDYMYKGFCFGVPFPLESVKRACEFQEYRSTDIVVAGFANSGGFQLHMSPYRHFDVSFKWEV